MRGRRRSAWRKEACHNQHFILTQMHGADVNTMERGMLFVVSAVVPIISTTTSLSLLNSSRPESSTRLLISMDVTPRRPIHRVAPRRQSARSFSFISIRRARYSSFARGVFLRYYFIYSLVETTLWQVQCINGTSTRKRDNTRRVRASPFVFSAPFIELYASLRSSISRASHSQ